MTKEKLELSLELELDDKNIKDVVEQFRCPKGDVGIVMGEFLNNTNNGIIKESIEALDLDDKNRVLELGHGNCSHLPFLMEQAAHLKYFGMEISDVMLKEASRINADYIKNKDVLFQLYDGIRVPYVHNIFDRILTVNTIYFWGNPVTYLQEMFRVLKPGGIFVLAFTNSKFIEELSLVANSDDFVLYNKQDIENMIAETDFIVSDIEDRIEKRKDKDGNWVDTNYNLFVLKKKERIRYYTRS